MGNLSLSAVSKHTLKGIPAFEALSDIFLSALISGQSQKHTSIIYSKRFAVELELMQRQEDQLKIIVCCRSRPAFLLVVPQAACGSSLLEVGRSLVSLSACLPDDFVYHIATGACDFNPLASEVGKRSWILQQGSSPSCAAYFYPTSDIGWEDIQVDLHDSSTSASLPVPFSLNIPPFDVPMTVKSRLSLPASFLCAGSYFYKHRFSFTCSEHSKVVGMITRLDDIDEQTFPAVLDMGTLDLSLTELANMRQGMQIVFDLPAEIPARLRIHEKTLVRGMLKFSDSGVVFEVVEAIQSLDNH